MKEIYGIYSINTYIAVLAKGLKMKNTYSTCEIGVFLRTK